MSFRCIILLFLLIALSGSVTAQYEKVYELLTEPAVKRPLTLHSGQLQINAVYHYRNGNASFNAARDKLKFEEDPRNFVSNDFCLSVLYGISELLEFEIGIDYIGTAETLPSVVLGNYPYIGYVSSIYQTRGLNDLKMKLSYNLPFKNDLLEWALYLGGSIPVTRYKPDRPSHSIFLNDPLNPESSYDLIYRYNLNPGTGTVSLAGGSSLKLELQKLAFILDGSYYSSVSKVSTIEWRYRLTGDQFEYFEHRYSYLPPWEIRISLLTFYQALPWFAVNGRFSFEDYSRGWTEISYERVLIPQQSLGMISAGFEIQVSTYIRFLQMVNITLFGKNQYSQFSVNSGFSFNLVPNKMIYQ